MFLYIIGYFCLLIDLILFSESEDNSLIIGLLFLILGTTVILLAISWEKVPTESIRYYSGKRRKAIHVKKHVFPPKISNYIANNIVRELNVVFAQYLQAKGEKKHDYKILYAEYSDFFGSLKEDIKRLADDYKAAGDNQYQKEIIEQSILKDGDIIRMVDKINKQSLKIEKKYKQYDKDKEAALKDLYRDYRYDAFHCERSDTGVDKIKDKYKYKYK